MRKKFKPEERAVFTVGAHVEYRNGSHWHPAIVDKPIAKDEWTGADILLVHVTVTTKTISPAWPIEARPGSVRVPQATADKPWPREYNGGTYWACCVSAIGPACEHMRGLPKLTGLDMIRIKGQAFDAGRVEA